MADFSTRIMTCYDPDFYSVMGPFLSRREIVKEIGGPIWDEPDKVWFVRTCPAGIAGFSALQVRGQTAYLLSSYTLPAYRRQGIYTELLQERLAFARKEGCSAACVTATAMSQPMLLAAGFREVGKRGRYTKMEIAL